MKNDKVEKSKVYAFCGGLTGGPITPLLALWETIQKQEPQSKGLLIDVRASVSKNFAQEYKLPFKKIFTAKLARYRSWQNILMPFKLIIGFFQSLYILHSGKVNQIIGAGGFVQVPVMWAGWLLRIPIHIHQQDIQQSLANRLCLPIATTISVTFSSSRHDFNKSSGLFSGHHNTAIHTGNPVRNSITQPHKKSGENNFGLNKQLPTLLVLGGGSGAEGINRIIWESLPQLAEVVQILHSTGVNKASSKYINIPNYHPFPFIQNMGLAYASSDLVLSRAGVGTISELSKLKMISLIVPMPDTHQELNARFLYEHQASIVLDQNELNSEKLLRLIRRLILDHSTQTELSQNIGKLMPNDPAKKMYEHITQNND